MGCSWLSTIVLFITFIRDTHIFNQIINWCKYVHEVIWSKVFELFILLPHLNPHSLASEFNAKLSADLTIQHSTWQFGKYIGSNTPWRFKHPWSEYKIVKPPCLSLDLWCLAQILSSIWAQTPQVRAGFTLEYTLEIWNCVNLNCKFLYCIVF